MNERANRLARLIEAQEKARTLFELIEAEKVIRPHIKESELSTEISDLARKHLSIQKFWHKRIVRTGHNTIFPFDENPEDLTILPDDILWIDFAPVFNEYEADFARTFVLGNNDEKHRIKESVEDAWLKARDYFVESGSITGRDLFQYIEELATNSGFSFGNEIAGHLIDEFSHYKTHRSVPDNYICRENDTDLKAPFDDKERFWILEVHFVNRDRTIGSFFEQLLV